jgi:aldehyde dehydrogenase (NAD+)
VRGRRPPWRREALWAKHECRPDLHAPDYVLIGSAVRDRRVEGIARQIRSLYGEAPARTPDLGLIVNERHHGRLMNLLGSSGSIVVTGAKPMWPIGISPPMVVVDSEPDSALIRRRFPTG